MLKRRIEPKNGLGHKRITKPGQPVYMPCFDDGEQIGYVIISGVGKYDCYDNHGLHFGTRFQIVDARELVQSGCNRRAKSEHRDKICR